MFGVALSPWLQAALGLILIVDLGLLAAEHQRLYIRLVALHGALLGVLPLLTDSGPPSWRLVGLTVIFLAVKAIALPMMLRKAYASLPPSPPITPYMGYNRCILAGLGGFGFSLWLAHQLPMPANALFLPLFAPAFATIFTGLLLIITRRKALTQVMGYLIMENGIYLLGVPLARHDAMWLELSILLDVFVGIFVMVLAIRHIHRVFDTTDVDRIASLRD